MPRGIPAPTRRPNVAGHSYVTSTGELTVTFHNGRSYRYDNVPLKRAAAFSNVQSKGEFLHSTIIPHHGAGTEIFPNRDDRRR